MLAAALCLIATPVPAEEPPTGPLTVKIVDTTYTIPRNYVATLGLRSPILKVTYPGFEPLSDQTKTCFDRTQQDQSGCSTLELRLTSGAERQSNEERFRTFLTNSKAVHDPKLHPYGYDFYVIGSASARVELYRNPAQNVYFYCDVVSTDPDMGICNDNVLLKDGNGVKVFFGLDLVGKVDEIESKIRGLMAGFATAP